MDHIENRKIYHKRSRCSGMLGGAHTCSFTAEL